MSDGMTFDFSELTKLAADLGHVPDTAGPFIRSAVEVTSRKVKDESRKKVRGRKHFKGAARGIDYEIQTVFGQVIQSEIGYDKETDAGKLGNLVEFGAPGAPNALTPGNELQTSLEENEADFVEGLQRAGADALQAALDGSSLGNIVKSYVRKGGA